MAGHGEEDRFGLWFGPSSLKTTDRENVTVENRSYLRNVGPGTSDFWEIMSSENHLRTPTSPGTLRTTRQPQNRLIPGPAFRNPTTENRRVDLRYDRVNPPRVESSRGSADYGMYVHTNPASDNVTNVRSLETGLSRLNLQTPYRPSHQLLGASSRRQPELLSRNRVVPPLVNEGSEDLRLRSSFESHDQYPYMQNGSRRNASAEMNRAAAHCFSRFDVGSSSRSGRNQLSSDDFNHGYPISRSMLDLATQRSSARSFNGELASQRIGGGSFNDDFESHRSGGRSFNGDSGDHRSGGRSLNDHLGWCQRSGGRSFDGDLGWSQRSGGISFHGHGSSSSSNSNAYLFQNNTVTKPRYHQRTYSLSELRGRVCSAARDPLSRGFLEETIVKRNQAYIELIFSEVMNNELFELIVDQSASHLMQKLVIVLNEDQMTQFIRSIITSEHRLLVISNDEYGTYVMQRLVERSLTPLHKSLLSSALKNIAGIMSNARYGHHVIMHCLRRFSTPFITDLVEDIVVNTLSLATNKNGCCVLQYCIEHTEGTQKWRLIGHIVSHSLILSGDAFGNYVMQNILENIPHIVINDVIARLTGHCFILSKNRHGSNVVEKCLKKGNAMQSEVIMLEIISHPDILELATNNYGNYVVQLIWNLSQGRPLIKETVRRLVQRNYMFLKTNIYGKRVLETVMGNK